MLKSRLAYDWKVSNFTLTRQYAFVTLILYLFI